MLGKVITIFGGTGFLGRYVVRRLAKEGAFIRVGARNPDAGKNLLPMGNVGQIKVVLANVRHEATILPLIQGSDIVINLVGTLVEKGAQTFHALHEQAAARLARLTQEAGVPRFLHVSALGAGEGTPYARSKAAGERAVFKEFPQATIVRPNLVFGPDDHFLGNFATLARCSKFFPLVGEHSMFQPVYVADVAEGIYKILHQDRLSQTFDMAGPQTLSVRQLVEMVCHALNRSPWLIPLPFPFAYVVASLLQWFPGSLLTVDQVRLLYTSSVSSGLYPGLSELGIKPAALAPILQTYLKPITKM